MPGKRVRPAILIVLCASLLVFANTVAASGDEPERAQCKPVTPFSATNFSNPTKIDNKWNPLVPGTQFTMNGVADRGGGLLPHQIVTTVTDLTKVINGVRAVVLLEKDINEGELQEAELRFEAQDNAGNIWNLGEYPEEWEDGKFHAAPDVWLAGLAEAEPGNSMVGNPQLGTPEYLQGWAPEIEFLDCATVSKMQQRTCIPVGCYEGVMIIDERSPLEPDSGYQRKFYAPDVGNIHVTAVDDPEGETLVLSKVSQLSREQMAKAREEALQLEKRAYKGNAVYRQTQPADPPAIVPGTLGG
ncbi:MAG TPA: hypothetical protein VJ625_02530 [Propionibacteriaceae bacterium]|nr:hypothetical protein [Propionibacteriaceae bacterium]